MLTRYLSRHTIAIGGQVKDAVTGAGIPRAVVKILEAPDRFIDGVLFRVKLLGLPSLSMQWQSLGSVPNPAFKTLPRSLKAFYKALKDPQSKSAKKLKLFQIVLEDEKLTHQHQFAAVRAILDCLTPSQQEQQNQLGRTQTTRDGWFYFKDLPGGVYQLEASFPSAKTSYSPVQLTLEIGPENRENSACQVSPFDRIGVEFNLQPTTLLGKVTSLDDREAIGMAKVQIQGSSNYTLTANELTPTKQGDWNYRLVGIAARDTPLTVIVSARGYLTQQEEITLQTGDVKSLDFQLVPQR